MTEKTGDPTEIQTHICNHSDKAKRCVTVRNCGKAPRLKVAPEGQVSGFGRKAFGDIVVSLIIFP